MKEQKEYLMEAYQNLSAWLEEATEIEKPKVTALLKKASEYAKAAENMSEEKVNQFVENLRYDLHEFYQQNQAQSQHSVYLGLLNESLWSTLAQLTDKSQVEWAELTEDFEHKGLYHTGDIIGFGELVCQNCQQSLTITHVSEVGVCARCGGESFTRLPLNP